MAHPWLRTGAVGLPAALCVVAVAVIGRWTTTSPLPGPEVFFAAVPSVEEGDVGELRAVSDLLCSGMPGAVTEPVEVLARPGARVVFWALDHGSFEENGHYVFVTHADDAGHARATPRLGASGGLYRIAVASDGARGCVTFFVVAPVSAERLPVGGGPDQPGGNQSPDCSQLKLPEQCLECERSPVPGLPGCCDAGGAMQFGYGAYLHRVVDFGIDQRRPIGCASCGTTPAVENSTMLPALELRRDYDSRGIPRIGWFGRYWETEFERELTVVPTGPGERGAFVHLGASRYFVAHASGDTWVETTMGGGLYRFWATLGEPAPGTYRLTMKDGTEWHFALRPGTPPGAGPEIAAVVAKVDANGNRIDVLRDSGGRAVGLRDSHGKELHFRWAPVPGLAVETIAEVTRPDGQSITYEYDAALPDLLRRVGYPGGEFALYDRVRDANGDQLLVFDDARGTPGSRKHRVAIYDNDQQVFRLQSSAGQVLATRVITGPDDITVTRAGGPTWRKTWREGHYLERLTIDGGSGQRSFVQGANFQILAYTDELGRSFAFAYDGQGNLVRTDHPDGTTERWTFEPVHNRLVRYVDRLGRESTWRYDAAGNLLGRTWPDGAEASWTYDARGRVVTATDRRGFVTRYAYDADGYLAQVALPDDDADPGNDPRWSFGRDVLGRLATVTDPAGHAVEYGYDAQDRVVVVRHADGTTERTVYGSATGSPGDPIGETGLVVATKDRRDNWTLHRYDADDRLVRTTLPDGATVERTYVTGSRRLRTLVDRGDEVGYEYDQRGRLIRVTRRPDRSTVLTWHHEYDAQDRVVRRVDPYGFATRFGYDLDDRVTSIERQISPQQSVTVLGEYDAVGNLIRLTDGSGNTWSFEYDAVDRLRRAYDPAPTAHLFRERGYDASGNLLYVQDQAGDRWRWTYTARGRVATEVDPTGVLTEYAYTLDDRVASVRVPATRSRRDFDYDCCGRIIRAGQFVDRLGQQILERYAYDGNGNRTDRWDGEGHHWRAVHDGRDRLVEAIAPRGGVTRYEYGDDAAQVAPDRFDPGQGSFVRVIDGEGGERLSIFDGLGRIAILRDADGGETVSRYDTLVAGWPTREVVDADGGRSIDRLDAVGRVRHHLDALQGESAWDYDGAGRLVGIVDPRGNTTRYEYDPRGNRILELLPGPAAETRFTYGDDGRLRSRLDPAGVLTRYEWDAAGRILARRYPDDLDDRFRYDAGGRLVEATSERYGAVVTREYDSVGRLLADVQGTARVAYLYDRNSRPTVIGYPSDLLLTLGYDEDGEPSSLSVLGVTLAEWSHDAAGRPVRSSTFNGVQSELLRDAGGALRGILHTHGGRDLQSYRYVRDGTRQVTVAEDLTTPGRSETFAYDPLARLVELRGGLLDPTGAIPAPARQQSWDLDAVGSWRATTIDGVTETRDHGAGNQVTRIGARTVQFDGRGSCAGDGVLTYVHDVENRLAEVHDAGGALLRFRYDAFGRRIETEDVRAGSRTQHVHRGWQVIEDRGAAGLEALYVHGHALDETVLFANRAGLFVPLPDQRGAVVALADWSGRVVERYGYSAYGERVCHDPDWQQPQRASRFGNPFGLGGLRHCGELGLLDARLRTMDPDAGRFLERDPLHYVDSLNLYEFVRGDPVNGADPFGLATSPRVCRVPLENEAIALAYESCLEVCVSGHNDAVRAARGASDDPATPEVEEPPLPRRPEDAWPELFDLAGRVGTDFYRERWRQLVPDHLRDDPLGRGIVEMLIDSGGTSYLVQQLARGYPDYFISLLVAEMRRAARERAIAAADATLQSCLHECELSCSCCTGDPPPVALCRGAIQRAARLWGTAAPNAGQ
ncbi:MAG: RHS repeat protein [Planctomycetes bacterium]|nr:RHS repeat protein [Planctomycetota bacterium]